MFKYMSNDAQAQEEKTIAKRLLDCG